MTLDTKPLHPSYSEYHQNIAHWLLYQHRPQGISRAAFQKLKRLAIRHFVQDGYLFRKHSKNLPLRRVVDDEETKIALIAECHESGRLI